MKSPKNRTESCPNNIGYTKLVSLFLHRMGCFSKHSFINLPFVFINFRLSYISVSVLKLSAKMMVLLKIIRKRLIVPEWPLLPALPTQAVRQSQVGARSHGERATWVRVNLASWRSGSLLPSPSHVPSSVRSALVLFLKYVFCAPRPRCLWFLTSHSEMKPLCLSAFDIMVFSLHSIVHRL